MISSCKEGLQLIGTGDRIKLIIPSSLGYGSRDLGIIPSNSILIFDFTLTSSKNQLSRVKLNKEILIFHKSLSFNNQFNPYELIVSLKKSRMVYSTKKNAMIFNVKITQRA